MLAPQNLRTFFLLILFVMASTAAQAGCGGGGAGGGGAGGSGGSGGAGSVNLGSNDLPSDMNYPPGQSPRELYIKRYEKVLEAKPDDLDAMKRLGIVYHHQSAIFVPGSTEVAIDFLKKVLEKNPDDQESRAFLGSAMTMVARDSWNPFTKMSMVNEGADLIDEAIEKSPKNVIVRLVRANNSLNLPDFMKRRHFVLEDFLFIESIADDPEADFGIPSDYGKYDTPDVLAKTYYQLGMVYQLEGEQESAVKYFKKSVASWEESRWAQGAMQMLAELKAHVD